MEKDIENSFITNLIQLGYNKIEIKSDEDMLANIAAKLTIINKNELNGQKLTIGDIKRLINKLEKEAIDHGNNYAYYFNRAMSEGKDLENFFDDGRRLRLKLISTDPNNNYWEVANQISDWRETKLKKRSYRYDVTIFLNGFPVIQVELKDTGIELSEAINQINRYIDNGYSGLFKFIQLFIVSNYDSTRYGVNTNKKIKHEFMFRWSDEKNNILDSLTSFTESFLTKRSVFDILTKYMIRFGDPNNKSPMQDRVPLVVLRPYQIYAIKEVVKKATMHTFNPNGNGGNGYIFHTTGSGKTLTSWKCAQIAAEQNDIDKVIFLVDRKDLDEQTMQVFRSIESGNIALDKVSKTKDLIDAFQKIGKGNKLILTTIQKFSRAVELANKNDADFGPLLSKYKDKHIVFIIDECHRTQFGDMHTRIKKYFTYAQYIGFTGTPITEENKGLNANTTAELFGSVLHTYNIADAINDGNVLGFSVEYHKTVKENEKLKEMSKQETTTALTIDNSWLMDKKRIEEVVKTIFNIHMKKTDDGKYTALFAVQSIPMLLAYYDEFKRQNELIKEKEGEGSDRILRVSAIYTAQDNNDEELSINSKDKLDEIIVDFNNEFKTQCKTVDFFRSELAKSLKGRNTGTIGQHIDIVIVVGIFLTGFDSQMLSTLYVDKNLEYHGLLQAFSRTNRVESESKRFGNIICFRAELKENVDKAIRLFSSDRSSNVAVMKDFKSCLDALINRINALNIITSGIPSGYNISDSRIGPNIQRNFIVTIRDVNKAIKEVKQFIEFEWNKHIGNLLTEDRYVELVNEQKKIYSDYVEKPHEKESILDYVDFCIELVSTDKIDYEYIHKLISEINTNSLLELKRDCNKIKELVDRSNSETIRYKRELIKNYLDRLVDIYEADDIHTASDVTREFKRFMAAEKSKDIKDISDRYGVDDTEVRKALDHYNEVNKIDKDELTNQIRKNTPGFHARKEKKHNLFHEIIGVAKKYAERIFKI